MREEHSGDCGKREEVTKGRDKDRKWRGREWGEQRAIEEREEEITERIRIKVECIGPSVC